MNQLESQKRLLIAESELNRAHLIVDLAALSVELRALTDRATSIGSLTTSAVGLVAGLVALQRTRTTRPETNTSWLQTLLNGTGLLTTLWRLWRQPGRDR